MAGADDWAVRAAVNPSASLLVVTSAIRHLQQIADQLADAGFLAVIATPSVANELLAAASFDLVVLLPDLLWGDRCRMRTAHTAPRRRGRLIDLAVDEVDPSSGGLAVALALGLRDTAPVAATDP